MRPVQYGPLPITACARPRSFPTLLELAILPFQIQSALFVALAAWYTPREVTAYDNTEEPQAEEATPTYYDDGRQSRRRKAQSFGNARQADRLAA